MMERPELFNIGLESFINRVEDGTFLDTKKDTYTLG
jgi:hypothetical protein